MGNNDWCNDEIWENVWARPLGDKLSNTLLYYSRLVSDNYEILESLSKEMENLEDLLEKEIGDVLEGNT